MADALAGDAELRRQLFPRDRIVSELARLEDGMFTRVEDDHGVAEKLAPVVDLLISRHMGA